MKYFFSRLYVMYRVIQALIFRETKTRFGQKKLGYIWLFIEPISQIAVFAAIFGIVMKTFMPGVDYLIFLTIGVLGWNFFQDTLNQSLSAVSANHGLLIYSRVKPIDTVLARAILEFIVLIVILPVTLIFLHFLGHPIASLDLLYLIIGLISLWSISLGVAMFFSVISAIRNETKWLVNALMRPLYFMSGVMYSISTVPPEYQKYLLWNPLVHSMGFLRKSIIANYNDSYVNSFYLFICCLVLLFLGVASFVSQEHRLRMD
jgi:capsular polysaccharide transport system permease protein